MVPHTRPDTRLTLFTVTERMKAQWINSRRVCVHQTPQVGECVLLWVKALKGSVCVFECSTSARLDGTPGEGHLTSSSSHHHPAQLESLSRFGPVRRGVERYACLQSSVVFLRSRTSHSSTTTLYKCGLD